MKLLTYIVRGKAVIQGDSLRCAAPRQTDSRRTCNKLLMKKAPNGTLSGSLKCGRCHQEVIIETKMAVDLKSPI